MRRGRAPYVAVALTVKSAFVSDSAKKFATASGLRRRAQWGMSGLTQRYRHWCNALAWRLLPGICVLCEQASGTPYDLCAECRAALPWLVNPCPRCGQPAIASASDVCTACLLQPPPYRRCIAPLRYAEPVAQMIQRVKFASARVEARVLGGLLGEHLAQRSAAADVDVIAPVPLALGRLLRRGHNQAGLFAHWVSRAVGLPVDHALALRRRPTPPQTGLTRGARLRNLRGAFAVRGHLDGTRVAIVDDVVTTGATVTSLSRALLAAGATAVDVWAVARTLDPHSSQISA